MELDSWPLNYMFKFIVPNRNGKVDKIKGLLPHHGDISFKHTSSLKHVSITCVAVMSTADQIIEITEKVSEIEGVMVL
jgi:hypothetical protein